MFLKARFRLVCFSTLTGILLVMPLFAQSFDFTEDSGIKNTAESTGHKEMEIFSPGNIPGAIGSIIGAILSFIGVIFLILMIYSGFLWMIARGNAEKVDQAKTILTEATIGLVIVVAAYAITAFIGKNFI